MRPTVIVRRKTRKDMDMDTDMDMDIDINMQLTIMSTSQHPAMVMNVIMDNLNVKFIFGDISTQCFGQ